MIRIVEEYERPVYMRRYIICPIGKEDAYEDYILNGFESYDEAKSWCDVNDYNIYNDVTIIDTEPNRDWRSKIYKHNG